MNLTGNYAPSLPGARTLRDTNPLTLKGNPVTATVEGREVYIWHGGDKLLQRQLPSYINTPGAVNGWVQRTALDMIGL